MRNIRLTLQYDGTDYSGWQVQKEDPTVQGLLEKALFSVTGEHSRVQGASRTDAGVHAFGQVAAFRTGSQLGPDVLLRALNSNLPQDIRIIDASEADDDFHPRHRAKSKTYSYLISGPGAYSVFLKRYSWQMTCRLNCELMRTAAGYLIGEHDFSSFRASGCSSSHPVREVTSINISEADSFGFIAFTMKAPVIKITIEANAFLRHMARNIAGTLVDIGRGNIPSDMMKDILDSKDRMAAGQTAPARGLFLEKIVY
ncbi:MAG: tRNA pseudouridine(38-40) synthase TruA [Nitrospirota bacterium]|nr:tRNA pseudouridine(38-40) synthase TruA [Nitrospirota bacterium]